MAHSDVSDRQYRNAARDPLVERQRWTAMRLRVQTRLNTEAHHSAECAEHYDRHPDLYPDLRESDSLARLEQRLDILEQLIGAYHVKTGKKRCRAHRRLALERRMARHKQLVYASGATGPLSRQYDLLRETEQQQGLAGRRAHVLALMDALYESRVPRQMEDAIECDKWTQLHIAVK